MTALEIPSGLVAVQAMLLVQLGLGTCDFEADAGDVAVSGEFAVNFVRLCGNFINIGDDRVF